MNPELSFNPEHLTKHSSFDFQYNDTFQLELAGGRVKIYDVKPETPKTEVPVFIAPGWAATPQVFEENIRGLYDNNRRVISVDAPHGIEHESREDSYPDVELRKMAALIKSIKEKGVEQTDVVAHSEGAIYTIIAATLHPEKFRNIVLVNPAGMVGEDTSARLMVSFSLDIFRETINAINNQKLQKPLFTKHREAATAIAKDAVRSVMEVFAISSVQIQQMIRNLITEHGIGISILHAKGDRAFPIEKVKEIALGEGEEVPIHVEEVEGTHNQIYLESQVFTQHIEEQLQRLETT